MVDFRQFDYAWQARDFINDTLRGEYETITQSVGGYTVWYKRKEQIMDIREQLKYMSAEDSGDCINCPNRSTCDTWSTNIVKEE